MHNVCARRASDAKRVGFRELFSSDALKREHFLVSGGEPEPDLVKVRPTSHCKTGANASPTELLSAVYRGLVHLAKLSQTLSCRSAPLSYVKHESETDTHLPWVLCLISSRLCAAHLQRF